MHIRGSGIGLNSLGLGVNGPDSVGPLGPSDISVQSISTDSKTTHDDSDQVNYPLLTLLAIEVKYNF